MEKTLKIMKQEAYVEGWQDAVAALTKDYEDRLRSVIEQFELPKGYEVDDNEEESQG